MGSIPPDPYDEIPDNDDDEAVRRVEPPNSWTFKSVSLSDDSPRFYRFYSLPPDWEPQCTSYVFPSVPWTLTHNDIAFLKRIGIKPE